MRHLSRSALIATSTAWLAACDPAGGVLVTAPTTSVPKQQLIGADLTASLTGKSFAWIRARDQATGQTTFSGDGAMTWKRLDVSSSGVGSWKVEGEQLCQTFDPTPVWKGGTVCRKIYRSGTTLTTSLNDGGLVTYSPVTGS